MAEFVCGEETFRVLGACFEVYKDKGSGFLEHVFQECLDIEFALQGIPAKAQVPIRLSYKGRELKQHYVADFICFDRVVLEIKAVSKLADEHRAQVLNYLHASKLRVGLLVNFGHHPRLQHERFVI